MAAAGGSKKRLIKAFNYNIIQTSTKLEVSKFTFEKKKQIQKTIAKCDPYPHPDLAVIFGPSRLIARTVGCDASERTIEA